MEDKTYSEFILERLNVLLKDYRKQEAELLQQMDIQENKVSDELAQVISSRVLIEMSLGRFDEPRYRDSIVSLLGGVLMEAYLKRQQEKIDDL